MQLERKIKIEKSAAMDNHKNSLLKDQSEDMVSGYLYDKMQEEVIYLRKTHEDTDGVLNAKNDKIQMLQRKVDLLMEVMETESKKMRKEMAAREKEAQLKSEDGKQKGKTVCISKRDVEQS